MPTRPTLMATIGIVLALAISLVMTDQSRPSTAMPAVPAGEFVGESGDRSFLSGPQGHQLIIESSQLAGAVAFTNAPLTFQHVLAMVGLDLASDIYWVTETTDQSDGSSSTELYSLTSDGLTLHAYHGANPDDGVRLNPGVVELPFDPKPGDSWASTATGTSATNDSFTFTREGSIAAGQRDGCLDITLIDDVDGNRNETELTRCRGEGVVAMHGLTSTDPFVRGVDELRLDPPASAPITGEPAELAVIIGEIKMSVGMITAPVALGEGLVFANRVNGQLVFAAPADENDWRVRWRRRAGDDVLTLLGAGELAVAATTERTLVAYDAQGRWRWQSSTKDLISHLVRLDDQRFIALGLDGTLSIRSIADGTELWQTQVVSGSGLPLAIDGETMAIAAGRTLSIVSPDGQVHNQTLISPVDGMAWIDGQLIVADGDATLTAFDPQGVRLWQLGLPDGCRFTAALGAQFICASSTTLIAVSVADRKIAWQQSIAALGIAVVGDQLLVTGRQNSWLVAPDATIVERWPLARASASHWVVELAGGLVVMGMDGDADWWVRP